MKFDRSKFVGKFVAEAREGVQFLSKACLDLEKTPADAAAMADIKRAAHTLKGSARMLKFTSLSSTAHKAEDLFEGLMTGKVAMSPAVTDLLLALVDAMGAAVDAVGGGGEEPAPDEELFRRVDAALETGAASPPATPASSPPPSSPPPPPKEETAHEEKDEDQAKPSASPHRQRRTSAEEWLRVPASDLERVLDAVGEARLEQRVGEGLAGTALRLARQCADTLRSGTLAERETVVRNLVDDLTRCLAGLDERQHGMATNLRGLFDDAESMRMVPLGTIFDSFERPVRDLARARDRQVKLVVGGGEMRCDKQIVDALAGPLMHLVSNAVDHGLESPAARVASGKPAEGKVELFARGLAGAVEVVIRDDGRGIDSAALLRKAVERGLVSERQGAGMSREERLQLVFRAGLSSAEIITEVSGRGVGMDVVKKTVEDDLKGSVVLESEAGRGTTVTLRLPLSLSSRRVFLVRVGREAFAVPLSAVERTVAIRRSELIDVAGRRAVRLDNQFVPVEEASALLGLQPPAAEERVVLVLVSGAERLGFAVDDIDDELEVLIKPLPPLLAGLRDAGGVTFGEGGEPIPVLYVPDLVDRSRRGPVATAAPAAAGAIERRRRILVVDDSYNTREVQRLILESKGYDVILAGDGVEALERLAAEDVDLMVTDLEMPRMDGFALIERVRSGGRHTTLPIVILTSRETEGDRSRGVTVGANAYIVKRSFDEERLSATLETLLP